MGLNERWRRTPGQRFSRWFTEWPSTHARAGQTVEVVAVSALTECGACGQMASWVASGRDERNESVDECAYCGERL